LGKMITNSIHLCSIIDIEIDDIYIKII
jgi:hypothetical protein